MEKIWFQNYPEGSEKFLDTSKYESIFYPNLLENF